MLKQPVWIAAAFLYGGYIAFGGDACERSNRAVMPIHWAGQGINYVFDNLSTSGATKKTNNPTIADGFAGWLRDFVLVASVGSGKCTPFDPNQRLEAPASKMEESNQNPQASPSNAAPVLNDGKPVFHKQGN